MADYSKPREYLNKSHLITKLNKSSYTATQNQLNDILSRLKNSNQNNDDLLVLEGRIVNQEKLPQHNAPLIREDWTLQHNHSKTLTYHSSTDNILAKIKLERPLHLELTTCPKIEAMR